VWKRERACIAFLLLILKRSPHAGAESTASKREVRQVAADGRVREAGALAAVGREKQ